MENIPPRIPPFSLSTIYHGPGRGGNIGDIILVSKAIILIRTGRDYQSFMHGRCRMKKQFQQEIGVIRRTVQLLKISKKWHCRLSFKIYNDRQGISGP
jgi:hypothetical protein